jgi:chitodextrinase/uncharacterized Ntn-hydrolase superfamily protein
MKTLSKFPSLIILLVLLGITFCSYLLQKDQNLLTTIADNNLLEEAIDIDRSRDHEGDTFSIIAYDPVTGEVGGAACSCYSGTIDFLSDLVLDSSNNILGGIHTQAAYVSGNQNNARTRMLAGDTPSEIITWLDANDCCSSNANSRQYGIVGFNGSTLETAGYTGSSNGNWAGNITGPNYAIQGNILDASDQIDILNDMEAAFLNTTGTLADKLMAALQGAKRVGGDNRCQGSGQSGRSAFVKVLRPGDTSPYIFETTYPNIASYEPIDDLQCLYDAAVNTPFCRQTVSIFPYTMDFETKSWEKEATCNTYSSWIRSRFSTPSSNTGPTGSNQGTHYIFVEASDIGGQGTAPRSAIIGSPCFEIPDNHSSELTFDYHMWGSSMGTLALTASDNGGLSWTTLWSMSGDQGNNWTNDQSVDLSAFAGSTVKLRFDATLGNGLAGDMAIDDVQITVTSIVPDDEPPTTPTNLVASNTTSTTTDLSWSPSTDNIGVTGYDVYEGAGVIGTTSGTSFNVTGLSPETNYTFSVIAKDAAGNESLPSNSAAVTTDVQPPVNCTNLVGTFPYSESFESSFGVWIQSTADDLDWTRYSNSTPSRKTGPSGAFDGTIYIYVEANGNGIGYPNKRAILESPCFDLSDKTAANFDFNYHMYGSSDMGSLDLEVSLDGGDNWASIWNQTGNQGNAWLSQSINLASYLGESAVMVRFNRLTGGTWKADVAIDNITLVATGGPDIESPTAPTNLTASNTTTTTTDLSWTASTDNIGVTGYDVYEGVVVIGTTAGTSFNATGLTASTNYNFSVVAKDAAGNESPPSNSVLVTTDDPPDTEPPTAPTGLTASNTTMTSTDLSWTASTDNVGVTGYDVYEGLSVIGSAATTSFNVTGLSPSTNYSFTVVAKDAAGNESAASAPLVVNTLDDTTAPTAPTNLVATNTTSTTTDLGWTASTDNVGVIGYDVYEGVAVIGSTDTTSFNVTGLDPLTSYSFYVVAKDGAGNESGTSNTENVITLSESSSTVLHQGFFETGWDGWVDGGSDASRYSGSRSYEGLYSIRLRDNTSSSVMTLGTFNVTSYNSIEIEFYFYPNSMENGEDFWVQFHDGSSWNTVATYTSGTDFENDLFYTATVTVDNGFYNFSTNAQFRFRCDASGNNDHIYIDQVTITGNSGLAPISTNTITNLGGAFEGFLGDEDNSYIERDLVLYPNPVKTTLNVKLFDSGEVMTYRIIDITGKVVLIGELSQNSIDVEKLKSGIYFIEVNEGEELLMQSFIKE